MTLLFTAPDFMKDLRAFLRSQPDLNATLHGRVFFRMPEPNRIGGFPICRLYRVGGGPNPSPDVDPFGTYHVSCEIWGGKFADYDVVRHTVGVLEVVIATLPPGPLNPPNGTTYLGSASIMNSLDAPDPETGNPRYVTDIILTAKGL